MKNKTLYGLWSEWDMGFEYILFTTKEKAKDFAKKSWDLEDKTGSFDECWGDFVDILHYEVRE